MTEPLWLTADQVKLVQERHLKRFGGSPGVRDADALEVALSRPMNMFLFGEQDLAVLAAALAFNLARHRPFVDGGKRIAFLAMMAFLRRNGVAFRPTAADASIMFLALTAGEATEDALLAWVRENWPE